MRIAYFTETFLPRTDGIVTRLTRTIEELRRAGDEVLIVAPEMPGLPSEYQGAQVVGLPGLSYPSYPDFHIAIPLRFGRVARAVERFAPQIIHNVNPVFVGIAGTRFARRMRVPIVASYHTNIADYAHRYYLGWIEGVIWAHLRLLHNQARLNLCTSHPMLEMLGARGFQRLELWKPGVDTDQFRPLPRTGAEWEAARDELSDGHSDAPLLLYVGRLAREKGLERLVPALQAIPNLRLAFVGKGPAKDELKRAFAGLPATFLSPRYGEALAEVYAAADIFALPSSTETLGLVAIEAMGAGLPVLGARRGGLLDIIVDGETGYFFDPDTPGDLTAKLAPLVESASERRRMGERARERALGWSWPATTADLRAKYARVLGITLPAPHREPDGGQPSAERPEESVGVVASV